MHATGSTIQVDQEPYTRKEAVESTSRSIRLNSSKQAHAPEAASPLKNLAIARKSSPSEQLKTTHCFASALARSFVVSVLPVPAGPSGAPPSVSWMADMSVR